MLIQVLEKAGIGYWINPAHIAAIVEEKNGDFILHFARETAGGLKTIRLDQSAFHDFTVAAE